MTKTEIKFDGSEAEGIRLGFVTPDGVVIPSKREEYNLYMKECERREKYRNDKELISLGIVDEQGKVLDEEKLKEIEQERLEESFEELRLEREKAKASRKPGLFKRALQKIVGKKRNKDILKKATEFER